MRPGLFIALLLIVALGISSFIYASMLPDYVKAGGPLVILLMTLSILVVAFIIERLLALRKAAGKSSLAAFQRRVQQQVEAQDIAAAIQTCHTQRGSCANIMRAALEKFRSLRNVNDPEKVQQHVQAAIQESMMLEVPLLERNLPTLSTIASISTLVGLLGTTLGMIRAFRALAKSGAPDAIALSLGISEALINTAGGLFVAIAGTVAYNYFFSRIDDFTYQIDEANHALVRALADQVEARADATGDHGAPDREVRRLHEAVP